jgi:hypothetical protein
MSERVNIVVNKLDTDLLDWACLRLSLGLRWWVEIHVHHHRVRFEREPVEVSIGYEAWLLKRYAIVCVDLVVLLARQSMYRQQAISFDGPFTCLSR